MLSYTDKDNSDDETPIKNEQRLSRVAKAATLFHVSNECYSTLLFFYIMKANNYTTYRIKLKCCPFA